MATPREALAALAERITRLEERVAQLEVERANEWDLDDPLLFIPGEDGAPPTLNQAWDPETLLMPGEVEGEVDGAVIMARRAIQERGQERPPDQPVPVSETEVVDLGDGHTATFPKPTESAKEAWAKDAQAIMENIDADFGLSVEDAVEAYAKAGPLWLSAFNHDYLMSLPYEWRQAMVATVLEYAPQDGADLSRDILRLSAEESRDFGMGQLEADRAKM